MPDAPRSRSTSRSTSRSRQPHLLLIVILAVLSSVLVAPPASAAPVVATPTIVPFSEWAPSACPTPTGDEPAPVKRVVVHHTHEPVAHYRDEVLPALALTCKAHVSRGFSSIGYHYIVDPWGRIYQGRGGMPQKDGSPPATQAQGAHVAGTNAGAVGVVFLGDHDEKAPNVAALEAATQLLAWLLEPTGHDPRERVPVWSTGLGTARQHGRFNPRAMTGHSASNHTACPGKHLRELLPKISYRMRQLLAGEAPTSWAGLGGDAQLSTTDANPKAETKTKPKAETNAKAPPKAEAAKKAPKVTAATEARATSPGPGVTADAGTPDVPLAIGPLASPAEVLARGLRAIGLGSLAGRIAAPYGAP